MIILLLLVTPPKFWNSRRDNHTSTEEHFTSINCTRSHDMTDYWTVGVNQNPSNSATVSTLISPTLSLDVEYHVSINAFILRIFSICYELDQAHMSIIARVYLMETTPA